MTHPAPGGESLEDFIARISDALRFVFSQQRDDVVVLVGETDAERKPVPQSQAADEMDATVGGRTRIRRINDTLLVAL
jgi:hypothetical protein